MNNMAALFILSLVLAMNLISIAEAEKNLGLYYGDANCRKLARRISCSTLDGSVKLCPVIENLPILTVRLAKERIPNSCIFGSSYGIATGVIWVAGKCQGIFNTISCLDPSDNKSIEEEDSSEIEVNSSSKEMDDHSGIAQAFNEMNLTKIAEAWLDKHFRPEEYDQLYELLVALMNKNASYELIDELYPTSTSKQESQESRPDPNSQNRREKKTLKNILTGTSSGSSRRYSPTLKNLWKKFGVDIDEGELELSSKEYLSAETSTKLEEFKNQSEEDDNQTKPRITRDVDPEKKFVSGVVDKLATVEKHDSEEDEDEESKYINSERVLSSKYNNDDFDADDMEEKDERSSFVGDSRSEVQNNKRVELEDVESVDDSEKEAQTETEQTKETHSKKRNETELSTEITAEKENLDTSEGSSENKTLGKLDTRVPTKDAKKDHEYNKSNLQEKSKEIPESESVDKEGQREKSDEAKNQRNVGILNTVKDKRNVNGQIKTDNEIADETPSTKSFGSLGMDPTEDISERKTPNKIMSISLTDSEEKQNCTTRISEAEKAEFDDREKQNGNKIKGLNLRLSDLLKWHNKVAAGDKMGKSPGLWGSGSHVDVQQYPNDHEMAMRIRRAATTVGKSSIKLMNKNPIASKGKQILSTTKSEEENEDFDERNDLDESKNNKGLNQRLPNMQKSKVATTGKAGKQISGTDSQGVRGMSKKLIGEKQGMVNLPSSLDDEDDDDDSKSSTQSRSGSRLNSQKYTNDHKTASRIRRAAATVGKSSIKLMNKNPIASKGKQTLSTTRSEEENEDFDEREDLNESNNIKGQNTRRSNALKSYNKVATISKPGKQISSTDSQGGRVLSKKLRRGEKQRMAKIPNVRDDDDEDEYDSIPSKMSGSGSRLHSQKYTNDHTTGGRGSRESATVGKSSNKIMNKNHVTSKGKQNLSMTKSEEEKDFDENDDQDESKKNKGLNQRLPNMQKSKVATGKAGKQISGTDSQGVRGMSKKLIGKRQGMVNLPSSLDDEDDDDDSKSSTQSRSGSRLNSQIYTNDHKTVSRIRRAAATVGKSSIKLMNKNSIASNGKQMLSTTKSDEEIDFDDSDDLDESKNNKGLNQHLPNVQKSKVAKTGKAGKQISGTDSQGVRGISKKLIGVKQGIVNLPNSLDDEDDDDDSKSSTQSSSGSRLNSQKYTNDYKTVSRIRQAAATVRKSSNKLMNKNSIASEGKQTISMTKSEEEKEDFDESDDMDESRNNKGLNQRLPNVQKSKVATTGKPRKQISGTDSLGLIGMSKKLRSDEKQGMAKLHILHDDEDDDDDFNSLTQSSSGSRLNSQKYTNDHKTASIIHREAETVGKSSNKLMNKKPIASKEKHALSMMKSEEEKDFDESDDLEESKSNKALNQRLPNVQKSNVPKTGKAGKQISGTDSQGVRGMSKKLIGEKQGMVNLPNSLDDEDDDDDSKSSTQSRSGSRLNSQIYTNDHKTVSRIRRAAATVEKSSIKLMNKNSIASKGKQMLSTTKSDEEIDFDDSDDLDESKNNKGLNQHLPNVQKSKVAKTGKPGKQISGTDSQGVRGMSKKLIGVKQGMVNLPNSLDDEDDDDDSKSSTQSRSGSRLNSQIYTNDHKTVSRIRRAAATVGKSSIKLMNKNSIASKGKQMLSTTKSDEEIDFDDSDDLDESKNNKGLNQHLPNVQKSKVSKTGKPGKQISGTDSQGVRGMSKKLIGKRQGMVNLPSSLDDEDDDDDSKSSTQSRSGSRLNSQIYTNDHKMASRIRPAAATVGKSSIKLMNNNQIASKGKQALSLTKSEEEKDDHDESDNQNASNNIKALNQRLPNMQKSKFATGKAGKQISGTDSQGLRGMSKKLRSDEKQGMAKLHILHDDEDDDDDFNSLIQSSSGSRLNTQKYTNDHKTASRIRREAETVRKSTNNLMNKNPIASKGKQILSTTKSDEEKDFDESDDLEESKSNKALNQRLPNVQKSNVPKTGKPGKQISGTDFQGVRGMSKKLIGKRQGMVNLPNSLDDEDDDDDSKSSTQSSSGSRLNSQIYTNDHKTVSRIRRAAATVGKSSIKLMNKNSIASNGKQMLSTTKSDEEIDFDDSDDLDESKNNKGLNQHLPNVQKSKVPKTGKPGKQISGTDSQGVRGMSKKLIGEKQGMVNLPNSLDDEDDDDDSKSSTQSSSGSRLNSQIYTNDHKTVSRIRRAAATVGKSSIKLMNKNSIASNGKQMLSTTKSDEEIDFDDSDDLDESKNNKGLNQHLPNVQKSKVPKTDKPGKQISGTDSQGVRGMSKKLIGKRQGMVNLPNSLDDEDDDDDSKSSTQSSSGSRLNSQIYTNDHKTVSRIRRAAATVGKSSIKLMNKNSIASNGKQMLSTTKSDEEIDFDDSDDLDESKNNKGLNQHLPNVQKSKVAKTGKAGKQISGTDSQGVRGMSKKLIGKRQGMVKLPSSLDDEDDDDDSKSSTQSRSGSRLNSQIYTNDHKMASRIRPAAATVGKSSIKLMNNNQIASKGKQALSMTKSEEEKDDHDESDNQNASNNIKALNQRLPNMQKSKVATGKAGKQISGTDSQDVRGMSKKLRSDEKQGMAKLHILHDDEDDDDDFNSLIQSSSGSRLNTQKYTNDHKTASRIRREAETVGKSTNNLMNKNPIASKGKQILSTTKSDEEKDFDESDDLEESKSNKALNQRLPNVQKSKVAKTGKAGKQISGTDSQGVRGISKKLIGEKQGMGKLPNSLDDEDDDDDSKSSTQSSSGSRLNSQIYTNDHKTVSRLRRAAATVGKSSIKLMNKNSIASNGKQMLSTTKSDEEIDFDDSDDLDESKNNKGLNQHLPNVQKSKVPKTGKPGKQISGTDSLGLIGMSKKLIGKRQGMVNLPSSLDDEDDDDDSKSSTQSRSGSSFNSQKYTNDHKTAPRIRRAAATVGKSSIKLMNKNPIASKGKQMFSTTESEEEKEDLDESDKQNGSNNIKGLNQRLPNMQKSKVATTGKAGKQISGTDSQGVRGMSKKLRSDEKQGMAKLHILHDDEDDDDDFNSLTQSSSGSRLNSQKYTNDHNTATRIRRETETVGKSSNKLMNKNPIASKGKQILSMTKSGEEKDFDESDDLDESRNNKGLNERLPNVQKSKVATTGKGGKQISGTDSKGVTGMSKKLIGKRQGMVNLPNSLDDEDDDDDSKSSTQSRSGSRLNTQKYTNDHKMASRIRRAAATVGKSSIKLMNKNPIASKGKQILSATKSEEEKDFDDSNDLDESKNNKGLNQRLPNMQKSKVAKTGKAGKQILGTDSHSVRGMSKKLIGVKQGIVNLPNSLDDEDDDDDSKSSTQSSSGSRLNSQKYTNDYKTVSRIRQAAATVRKSSNKLMNKNSIASEGKQTISMTKSEEEKEDFDESDDMDESKNNKGLNQRLPNMQKSKFATTGKAGKQILGTDSLGVRVLFKKLRSGAKQGMAKPHILLNDDDDDDDDDSKSSTQSSSGSGLDMEKYANYHKTATRIRRETVIFGKTKIGIVEIKNRPIKKKVNLPLPPDLRAASNVARKYSGLPILSALKYIQPRIPR